MSARSSQHPVRALAGVLIAIAACGGAPSRTPHGAEASARETTAASSGTNDHANVVRDLFGESGEQLSPERLRRIAHVIRELEADPFWPGAHEVRFFAGAWIVETAQVHVSSCPFFTGAVTEEEAGNATNAAFNVASQHDDNVPAILVYHYVAGMAAFQIESGPVDPLSNDAQLAGVEAMLRVYEAARARNIGNAYPNIDDLLAKRNDGTLRGWYAEAFHCGQRP